MRTDLYSKIVFTVIALCLVYLSLQMHQESVSAQSAPSPAPPIRVIIVGTEGAVRVAYAGVSNLATPLDVTAMPLPVGGGKGVNGPLAVPVFLTNSHP